MSFLAGSSPLNWQRHRLGRSSLSTFIKNLNRRFSRPDAEISKELHGSEYTISIWNAGEISLSQWIQRQPDMKTLVAKGRQLHQSIRAAIEAATDAQGVLYYSFPS
ncbi:hypothetical protein G6O67_006615 [Ophiocordyceps sinensis]|uniref:Uncharacterized protein n=1 Tax=Ophiocordyceps sinensis TaxID=72228 RepID=A0A8H4LWH9_9HYPO|nr:hypothetical protein G6O67_006615 [Ophiocordyceps sinensis]